MTNLITGLQHFGHCILVIGICLTPSLSRAEVTAERSQHGVAIKIDGKLFTEYWTKAGHSPSLYPVIGPTGKPVTRSYPFTLPKKDGTHDHPHHQSIWFALDKVNGIDFWGANANNDKGDTGPHIAHRDFVTIKTGSEAKIVTRNDWMNGDERVLQDERTLLFGTGKDDTRWIDFAIRLKASDGDVTLGDTKEGAFAVRVADSMRVDAKQGGHIVSSEGRENANAWGMPARWVDYTGPADGETVGITIMSHPKTFRPEPRWHVRTYGLFAANPIGQVDFPHHEAAQQGPVTIKRGDSLSLRYRVLFHRGNTNKEDTEQAFRVFAEH
jgi:hypothetical protein